MKVTEKMAADAVQEVFTARRVVQILMAHKDGDMKRRLGLGYGSPLGYVKERDKAAEYVINGAFNLAVALTVIQRHPLVRREFAKAQSAINAMGEQVMEKMYGQDVPGAAVPADGEGAVEVDEAGGDLRPGDRAPVQEGDEGGA